MTSATTTPALIVPSPRSGYWSLMIIAVDVVALWGLAAYGRRENLAA